MVQGQSIACSVAQYCVVANQLSRNSDGAYPLVLGKAKPQPMKLFEGTLCDLYVPTKSCCSLSLFFSVNGMSERCAATCVMKWFTPLSAFDRPVPGPPNTPTSSPSPPCLFKKRKR